MGKKLKKALVIFAKQPVPGKVKTRLVPPLTFAQAAELYCRMLDDVLALTASVSDVTRSLFYDGSEDAARFFMEKADGLKCFPQQGKDLGERMAEAFREILAMGHGPAVLIGSDSPDLPHIIIEDAFARLEKGDSDAVFGPTCDGGYYLVGMTRPFQELFVDIPWSSDRVMQETLERANATGVRYSLLPRWADVDTEADLLRPELRDVLSSASRTREFLEKWIMAKPFDHRVCADNSPDH
jgi:rSAM/selenodomain-associated transferase 1